MRTEDPNSYWKFWKSLNPRNVTTGPTLADIVNYFEQQVYPSHVDYFDCEHMNNIIKHVTSFQHNVEHDKSNMTQFPNSPITAEAFDYVGRTALYYKLLNRGIDGNLLNII